MDNYGVSGVQSKLCYYFKVRINRSLMDLSAYKTENIEKFQLNSYNLQALSKARCCALISKASCCSNVDRLSNLVNAENKTKV